MLPFWNISGVMSNPELFKNANEVSEKDIVIDKESSISKRKTLLL
jgi:hypothetical protein